MLGLATAGVIFVFYAYQQNEQAAPEVSQSQKSGYQYPEPRHAIQGFKYNGVVQGRRKISITADKFSIQNKKMGFFRFGLMREAVFENAKVHIYGINKVAAGASAGDTSGGFSLGTIFSKDTLPSLSGKISGVRLDPVEFYLHGEGEKVTGIRGKKGAFRIKEKSIVFTGRARAAFAKKRINAGRIRFLPEKQLIVADKGVRYNSGAKQWNGKHLVTDIFLNIVKKRDRMAAAER